MAKSKANADQPSASAADPSSNAGADQTASAKADDPKPAATPAAEEATQEEETVTMVFPRPVTLNLGAEKLSFQTGPQEVPAKHADHWWLERNGVTRYEKKKPTKAS